MKLEALEVDGLLEGTGCAAGLGLKGRGEPLAVFDGIDEIERIFVAAIETRVQPVVYDWI